MDDLRAVVSSLLGCASVFASSDPNEVRCLVEPLQGDGSEMKEWLVRRLPRDRAMVPSNDVKEHAAASDHSPASVKTQPQGLEVQLDAILGITKESRHEDSSVDDGSFRPTSKTPQHVLDILYDHIPRYTAAQSPQAITKGLLAQHATAQRSSFALLRGVVETADGTELAVFDYERQSLQDLLQFNQSMLANDDTPDAKASDMKRRFIVYQLWELMSFFHERGISWDQSLVPSRIWLTEGMWVRVGTMPLAAIRHHTDGLHVSPTLSVEQVTSSSPTARWCCGDLSNFDYLMILNAAAGRRMIDSVFHPVFPWVSDFSSRHGGWRDLTKSKFRLNKGDNQLDRNYESSVIPHHITESLSEITFYIYMARRTPMTVLREVVRSNFQPKEYPSTMARMFSWTPDECIPEFFSDSKVFTSIHGGATMPDLLLPEWCADGHDFIQAHRLMLESDEVSSCLHKWIDLNFGVCLSGEDAVRNKNVPLKTKLGDGNVRKSSGFVQLFRLAHPQRRCSKGAEQGDIPIGADQQEQQADFRGGGITSAPAHADNMSLRSAIQIAEEALSEPSFSTAAENSQHGHLQGILSSPAPSDKKGLSSSFVKLKKKHKPRPKLYSGSEPTPVSPPGGRDNGQSRSPTVARFAHAIPKFFGADSPSHRSGVSPDHASSFAVTHTVNSVNQSNTAFPSGSLGSLGGSQDGGRGPGHSRPSSATMSSTSLGPSLLNSSIGAHASPGTHIFRDLWHQISKAEDEESNDTAEDGNSVSDVDWSGADFDTLDDTSLLLLRACPAISLKNAISHINHQPQENEASTVKLQPVYKLPRTWDMMFSNKHKLSNAAMVLSCDLFSMGCVMAEIYTAHPVFSVSSVMNYCSSYLEECGTTMSSSWQAKYAVEDQLKSVPTDIKSTILDFIHPHPMRRILAWRARHTTFRSADQVWWQHPHATDAYLPCSPATFPPGFRCVYDFFAHFFRARNWWDQLKITRRHLPELVQLPDDAFHVALPTLLSFFKSKSYSDTVNATQVCAATVFLLESVTTRLGRVSTRTELHDVLLRLYESPELPPVLKMCMSTPEVMKTIVMAFGPLKVLRHFFPAISDWLAAPPAYRSKHGNYAPDEKSSSSPPLFSSEFANMLTVSFGELASSDLLGPAIAVKYMLPSLLPLLGKIQPKWVRLTDERSLIREDSRSHSGTLGTRSAFGGKNGDGIHVAYAPKQVLYESHYVAEAILLVCRELPPSVVSESVLPHLCGVVPHLIDVAESVSSARIEGVPDELAREVYATLRVLRHAVRSMTEQTTQREFLQKRSGMLIDLLNGIQPPFLHRRTADAVISSIKGPPRTSSSERPALIRHNSAPVATSSRRSRQIVDRLLLLRNEKSQDLRAFTAVGVARTITGALQKVGPEAAIGATAILQSIDAFLVRCAAIYSELEVSDYQWRMASEVVSEFCVPLRALFGSETFVKLFPSVQGSSVLQLLLLPNSQTQLGVDGARLKEKKQYLRQTTIATDSVAGDEQVAADNAHVSALTNHVPELLQYAYRSARLNGVKTGSFLHVPLPSGSAWSQDLNEAIFLVQEERKKRRAASTASKGGGGAAWLRPRVKTFFFGRQEETVKPNQSAGSLSDIGRSWSLRAEVRHNIRAHSSSTRAVHVDHDEDLVVSASKNGSCRVWRLSSYPSQATGTVHLDSTNLLSARSLDDSRRAVAMSSASIHVWDIRTSQVMFQIPFGDDGVTSCTPLQMLPFKHYHEFAQPIQGTPSREVSALQGSADFVVSTSRKLFLVDARAAPRIVADWRVNARDTTSICATALIVTPSNPVGLIATGTTAGQVFLTDKRFGKCVSHWQALHDSRVVKIVQYAPSYILVVGSDREARVWKIDDERQPRLRMVVTNVPESVRETQISVQAYADSVLLYVAASAKLYTTRLIHDASPEARQSDILAVRLESWSLVDNIPSGGATSTGTSSEASRNGGASSPERSRLHRTKMSAQCIAVLPLRQVVMIGGDDGSLRTCV